MSGTVFSFGAVLEECLERDTGVVLAALLQGRPRRLGVKVRVERDQADAQGREVAVEVMNRPRYMNLEDPPRPGARFRNARGIPSYVEAAGGFTVGVDLIGALYAGCQAYGERLSLRGEKDKAVQFVRKAEAYKKPLMPHWPDASRPVREKADARSSLYYVARRRSVTEEKGVMDLDPRDEPAWRRAGW